MKRHPESGIMLGGGFSSFEFLMIIPISEILIPIYQAHSVSACLMISFKQTGILIVWLTRGV